MFMFSISFHYHQSIFHYDIQKQNEKEEEYHRLVIFYILSTCYADQIGVACALWPSEILFLSAFGMSLCVCVCYGLFV